MKIIQDFVRYETIRGDPIEYGGLAVTPLSKSLIVSLPKVGFIWKQPVGIEIENGLDVERIRIIDTTLAAQLGIFAVGILLTFVFWLIGRKN